MSGIIFNHTAHRELWDWLANNPGHQKGEWSGWQENGGPYFADRRKCFACHTADAIYLRSDVRKHCERCPLSWSGHRNVVQHCCSTRGTGAPMFGLFDLWDEDTHDWHIMRQKLRYEPSNNAACVLLGYEMMCVQRARMIRDLPLNMSVIQKHHVVII